MTRGSHGCEKRSLPARLFNRLIGERNQRQRHLDAERQSRLDPFIPTVSASRNVCNTSGALAIAACHRKIAAFNVANEIAYEFHLNGFIRSTPFCELVFKQDCQFNNVEQVEPEIVAEVRVSGNAFDIDTQMFSNKGADLACKRCFFQSGDSSSQCQVVHE
jgi:hypothetical protein